MLEVTQAHSRLGQRGEVNVGDHQARALFARPVCEHVALGVHDARGADALGCASCDILGTDLAGRDRDQAVLARVGAQLGHEEVRWVATATRDGDGDDLCVQSTELAPAPKRPSTESGASPSHTSADRAQVDEGGEPAPVHRGGDAPIEEVTERVAGGTVWRSAVEGDRR